MNKLSSRMYRTVIGLAVALLVFLVLAPSLPFIPYKSPDPIVLTMLSVLVGLIAAQRNDSDKKPDKDEEKEESKQGRIEKSESSRDE